MSIVPDPLAVAAQNLADAFSALDREWNATMEQIEDVDASEALNQALCEGFPLGRSIDDLAAETSVWAEKVAEVMANRPTVIELTAKELGDDIDKLSADLTASDAQVPTDVAYRRWQNGGLGGEPGRVGGIFTPTVLAHLKAVLLAVSDGHPQQIHRAADEFARAFRAARLTSRS